LDPIPERYLKKLTNDIRDVEFNSVGIVFGSCAF
jgi:hypothetical protein